MQLPEADILAEAIKDLGREGFSEDVALWVAKDADHADMQRAIEKFLCKAKQGGVNLLFFAGHGVETGQGTFLWPSDAPEIQDGYMDVGRATSVEGLKYKFSGKDRRSSLAIVLACCRSRFRPRRSNFLWIQKPTVLRVRPSNLGVITYHFVGFGATGSQLEITSSRCRSSARVRTRGRCDGCSLANNACLWSVGNGRMVITVVIIVPHSSIPY